MIKPTLSIVNCYSTSSDTYSIHCRCDRCRSRPSLIISNANKDISKSEISVILKSLSLGTIRQIDIDNIASICVYFSYWNDSKADLRDLLKNGNQAKITFKNAYDDLETWFIKEIEKEPRWFNYNWINTVTANIEFPANYLNMSLPGSCTPRADRKTKEEVLKDRKNRELYYYAKNIYQTYNIAKYDELIQLYGKNFVWKFDNNITKLTLPECPDVFYLQTNWIPQVVFEQYTYFNDKNQPLIKYRPHYLAPSSRPIKDRIYEPERKNSMLNIIANLNQTKYDNLKKVLIEELIARFWLCHKRGSTINPENIVGSNCKTKLRIVNAARKLLGLKEFIIDNENKQDNNYYCYFCNKLHIKPIAWDRWQNLYNTTPRCSCQYREITQERVKEAQENPEKFIK